MSNPTDPASAQLIAKLLATIDLDEFAEPLALHFDQLAPFIADNIYSVAKAQVQHAAVSRDPVYSSPMEFTEKYLAVQYASITGPKSRAWCPLWWLHPEAVTRIRGLWLSFEAMRQANPATGENDFLQHHGDYHINWLTSEFGPFRTCSHTHRVREPLPVAQATDHYATTSLTTVAHLQGDI